MDCNKLTASSCFSLRFVFGAKVESLKQVSIEEIIINPKRCKCLWHVTHFAMFGLFRSNASRKALVDIFLTTTQKKWIMVILSCSYLISSARFCTVNLNHSLFSIKIAAFDST